MKQNRYIAFIAGLLNRYKRKECLGLLVTFLYSGMVYIGPVLSQYIIDDVLFTKEYIRLTKCFGLFFIVLILQPILSYIQSRIFINISERITKDLRNEMYSGIISKRITFFYDNNDGEILSRIINDSRMLSDFVSDVFVVLLKNSLLILCVLVGMMVISVPITLCIGAILIVGIVIIDKLSKENIRLSLERQESLDDVTALISDSATNILSIKIYELQKIARKLFDEKIELNKHKNIRIRNANTLFASLLEAMTVICIMLIYAIGIGFFAKGALTIGNIVGLILYFQLIVGPIISLLNCNLDFKAIQPIIDRIDEFVQEESEEERNNTSSDEKKEEKNVIAIRNLKFRYDQSEEIFNGLNVDIGLNKISCVVGNSGCGKTTLSYLIMGMLNPDTGQILIDGKDRANSNKKISYVPQNNQLFNVSIKENIRLFDPSISDEQIYEICKKLNIYDDICRLKNGFETIITDKINISGGQAQRILIARALIKEADIIIMDEPTSALDVGNRELIGNALKELVPEYTFVIITHDEQLMENADEVIRIG